MIWNHTRAYGYDDDMTKKTSGKTEAADRNRVKDHLTGSEISESDARERSRSHIAPIIEKLSSQKRLSRFCRKVDISAQTARRWAKEGITQITGEFEAFARENGFEPESFFENELRPIHKKEVDRSTILARRIAAKAKRAAEGGKASARDLMTIDNMLDILLGR